jgi:hypothetical protein
MSLTTSLDLPLPHSPRCSIPVGMRHLSGPNFISVKLTSPTPISSWIKAQMSQVFTFRMDFYAIWATFVCKYNLGCSLQLDGMTFWHGENCARSTEEFLLAKTTTCHQ